MKPIFRSSQAFLPVLIFLILSGPALGQGFENGVDNSGFTALAGNQSVTLTWSPVAFPSAPGNQAGYLLIYSTSVPSLFSSCNGLSPDFAVENGTIVATSSTALPNQPLHSTVSEGLTNGITYYFLIVAYIWDGTNTTSYRYSPAANLCVTIPPDGPQNMILPQTGVTDSSVTGSFSPPMFRPAGYLLLAGSCTKQPLPVNGQVYQPGDSIGDFVVLGLGSSTSFNSLFQGIKLESATHYNICAFSYSISACTQTPVYSSFFASNLVTTLAANKDSIATINNFTACQDESFNTLTWKASCTSLPCYLTAQRSSDSLLFSDMDSVSANQITSSPQPYRYQDPVKTAGGKIFYRIRLTDAAGDLVYSRILSVAPEISGKGLEMMEIEQNPIHDDALLRFQSPIPDNTEILLLTADGKLLKRQMVLLAAGTSEIHLNTADLSQGVYILVGIFGNNHKKVIELLKQ